MALKADEKLITLNYISGNDEAGSFDTEIVDDIKNQIFSIIEEDKKLDKPVFLFIDEEIINKLAHYISGSMRKSVAVGIAGETASGKSTFTMDIINSILNFQDKHNLSQLITRVNTDDYYYDRSDMVKKAGSFAAFAKNYDLDVPEAFELDLLKKHIKQLTYGKPVLLPKYDMSGTAKRYDNHTLATPSPIILSEGLFTLTSRVKDAFDVCIYVHVSRDIQKERFFKRANDRNLGDAAESIFNNAAEKAEIYIIPSSNNADIIINGEASREDYKNVTAKFLSIVENIHLNSAFATAF